MPASNTEYTMQWQRDNPEKVRATAKRYRQNHADKIRNDVRIAQRKQAALTRPERVIDHNLFAVSVLVEALAKDVPAINGLLPCFRELRTALQAWANARDSLAGLLSEADNTLALP